MCFHVDPFLEDFFCSLCYLKSVFYSLCCFCCGFFSLSASCKPQVGVANGMEIYSHLSDNWKLFFPSLSNGVDATQGTAVQVLFNNQHFRVFNKSYVRVKLQKNNAILIVLYAHRFSSCEEMRLVFLWRHLRPRNIQHWFHFSCKELSTIKTGCSRYMRVKRIQWERLWWIKFGWGSSINWIFIRKEFLRFEWRNTIDVVFPCRLLYLFSHIFKKLWNQRLFPLASVHLFSIRFPGLSSNSKAASSV